MEYKVSIIIPVYNAEKYIENCINSIKAQTLDALEIILLDDGSSDNSGKICDALARGSDNISVYHLKNGGPSKARNIGLKVAKGKYIGFVDADDYIAPQMYEILYNLTEMNKADLAFCSYKIERENADTVSVNMNYESIYRTREEITDQLLSRYAKNNHTGLFSVCNKLFKRQLITNNRIKFDENLIRAEDAWFVFDYLKIANRVSFINSGLYYYRQVSTSTMHTFREDQYEKSKDFREKVLNECLKLKISIDYNELYEEFLYEAFVYCRGMIKQGNGKTVNSILSDSFLINACRYRKKLPIHLKILAIMGKNRLKKITFILIWFWSLRV